MTTVLLTTTGAGTWTPPAGVTVIQTMYAMGAAGNGAAGSSLTGGGGGGSGRLMSASNLTVTPGTPVNLQVGIGGGTTGSSGTGATWFNGTQVTGSTVGAGGAASGTAAGVGGAGSGNAAGTLVTNPSTGGAGGSAKGGGGGAANGGTPNAGTATAGGAGANAASGGGVGGAGGTTTTAAVAGTAGTELPGGIGRGGGGGGGSLTVGDTSGANGALYGGGGGGGYDGAAGGLGGHGFIILVYYDALVAESVTATDALTALLAAAATVAELITAADAPTASLAATATDSESVSATDALTPMALASEVESTSATDALVSAMAAPAVIAEMASATDGYGGALAAAATEAESAAATDALAALAIFGISIGEDVPATDALTASLLSYLTASIAESCSAGDGYTTTISPPTPPPSPPSPPLPPFPPPLSTSEGVSTSASSRGQEYLRTWSLVVSGASDAVDLSPLRIKFTVKQMDNQSPNYATIRVYNPSASTVAKVAEFTSVTLQAGYQGGPLGVIFQGTVKQFRRGRESPTDTYLEFMAADGDPGINFAVLNQSLAAGSTPAQQLSAAQQALAAYGVKAGSTPAGLGTTALPRGKVLFGMARDKLRFFAASQGMTWSVQNGTLTLIPLQGFLPGAAPVLCNSTTGMIGMPEQTPTGIKVRMLINPQLAIGSRLQINQGDIQQGVQDPQFTALPLSQVDPGIAANDGVYRIYVIEYTGDTRGNDWYADIITLAIDPTISQGLQPEYINRLLGPPQ